MVYNSKNSRPCHFQFYVTHLHHYHEMDGYFTCIVARSFSDSLITALNAILMYVTTALSRTFPHFTFTRCTGRTHVTFIHKAAVLGCVVNVVHIITVLQTGHGTAKLVNITFVVPAKAEQSKVKFYVAIKYLLFWEYFQLNIDSKVLIFSLVLVTANFSSLVFQDYLNSEQIVTKTRNLYGSDRP